MFCRMPDRIPLRRLLQWLTHARSIVSTSANSASVIPVSYSPHPASRPLRRPAVLGTTFSQLQCAYLGLDYRTTFRQICQLGFDRIRLCSYWNEIEPIENQFDFTVLDWLLEESDRQGIELVLAVGMKTPRWPEFHFPNWLSDRYHTGKSQQPIDQRNPAVAEYALRFIESVVNHTRQSARIGYWQIENEPFTHLEIAGGRFLSHEFVHQEVQQVRQLARSDQKIVLTGSIVLPFADDPEDEAAFQACLKTADAVGLNVYSKVPIGQTKFYIEPQPAFWQTLYDWRQQLRQNNKAAWIAEAQAEPWEPNQLVATQGIQHPSSSPAQAIALVQKLVELEYDTILLWGCEYWYWHLQQGRSDWWNAMQELIQAQGIL